MRSSHENSPAHGGVHEAVMHYKAFVSSTYIDLQEHRAGVIDALRKAGFFVDPMEDWTAESDEPKSLSVERMRDCDLCILLVAARRGHVPENETLRVHRLCNATAPE